MPARYPVRRTRPVERSPGRPSIPGAVRVPVNDNLPRPANSNWSVPARWRPVLGSVRGFARGLVAGEVADVIGSELLPRGLRWLSQGHAEAVAQTQFGAGWTQVTSCTIPKGCVGGAAVRWIASTVTDASAFTPHVCDSDCFGGAAPAGNNMGTGTIAAGQNRVFVYWPQNSPMTRMQVGEKWARHSPYPSQAGPTWQSAQSFAPWHVPLPEPSYVPTLDPFSVPVGQPAPMPQPVPWHVLPEVVPNPYRHPVEQSEVGPAFRPAPQPYQPAPGITVVPSTDPDAGPTVSVDIPVSPTVGVPTPPAPRGPHRRTPPRVPERKWGARRGGAVGAVMAAVNAATEGRDLLNALWKALPPRYKTRVRGQVTSPWQKFQDLANGVTNGLPASYLADAFANVAENEASDRFYGALGQVSRAAARQAGFPGRGFQTGPQDTAGSSYGSTASRERRQRERDRERQRRRWSRFGGPPGE